jgi:outer membrane biosynthesis protein TonB
MPDIHLRHRHRSRELDVRDAAVRRLSILNRWLVAGSVTVTGLLAELAAHTFHGRTIDASRSAHRAATAKDPHRASSHTSTGAHASDPAAPLQAPERAPEATTTQEETPSTQASPPPASTQAQEAAPSSETPAAASESAPAPEATHSEPETTPEPAQESAPVVSGGS